MSGLRLRRPGHPSSSGGSGDSGRRRGRPDTAEAGPGPAVVEPGRGFVRVGDGYAATFAVIGYPAEVGPAWLEALLGFPGRVDVAVHIDPVPPAAAAPLLKRQRARLESTRRLDADAGRLGDPLVEAAATDAEDLAGRIARGAARLFRTGIYATVHARTPEELEQACAQVRSAAAGALLDLAPVTWRHHDGYTTTLPLGADRIGMRRILDTDALAAAFPFASADPPCPPPGVVPDTTAVLYGVNPTSNGVLLWDRWSQDNANAVVLARSGAGKSYFVKLEVLRNLYQGVAVAVIDPEDEYTPLAGHVGGTVIQLGAPAVRLNPLDLPAGDRRPDALTRRGLFLHTLITVMLGAPPTPTERAVLDTAITATYRAAGITPDPATWHRPAPRLGDLTTTLTGSGDPAAADLAIRLHPWTEGSFADLVNGPTTLPHPSGNPADLPGGAESGEKVGPRQSDTATRHSSPAGGTGGAHLTVWSLRHLPDEIRAVGTLLALDAVWRDTDTPTPPHPSAPHRPSQRHRPLRRLVVVDEAWMLLRDGEGARFLFRMAKAARKRATGLTVVTQDAADVLGSDLGLAVVSNAATQILMRQAPQAIDAVTTAFGLTAGEARLLLNAPQGEGLLIAGTTRVPFRAVASTREDIACSGQTNTPFDTTRFDAPGSQP